MKHMTIMYATHSPRLLSLPLSLAHARTIVRHSTIPRSASLCSGSLLFSLSTHLS